MITEDGGGGGAGTVSLMSDSDKAEQDRLDRVRQLTGALLWTHFVTRSVFLSRLLPFPFVHCSNVNPSSIPLWGGPCNGVH